MRLEVIWGKNGGLRCINWRKTANLPISGYKKTSGLNLDPVGRISAA